MEYGKKDNQVEKEYLKMISVIIPVFNIEQYLEKCIESIVNQTYRNLQIILVDDGSTDKSGDICDIYAQKDSRIKVIHKKNGGLSDARNDGLEKAEGDLVSFIDGDDWIHPQMYEIMTGAIEKTSSDMAVCQYQQTDEKSFLRSIDICGLSYTTVSGTQAMTDMSNIYPMAWNKLYRREIFDNLRYPVGKLHEDEFVIHKIFRKANKIAITNESLYFYALRDGSITSGINIKRIEDSFQAYTERVDFCREERWEVVIPAVVNQYCDFCLRTYYDLQKKGIDSKEYDIEKLWKSENVMISQFPNMKLEEKYRRFAVSPKEYEKWVKKERLSKKIKNLLGIAKDERKHG